MIPDRALGFDGWEDREILWAKTKELWLELKLCDECGRRIDDVRDASALYVNRLETWTLTHRHRCGMELVLRENGILKDLRSELGELEHFARIIEENTPGPLLGV